ncbi:probable zinc metalloprotease EGY1, chloroplastic [Chenopodium quinoa]|uniref:Peptidase M50 domain-containing protein n=1 Tax=Chenopodium quinoa TaxID=63459 RepID=A0A803MW90_CHEQI|nr:probable zinc metalloprotease EGY1, chloroplastic [Chenopodium quinoa]
MGTFTSCGSLITLNFRTTINGVPSFSSNIHRKPQNFNGNFGLKFDNNNCYLCQKGLKRNLLNTQKNRGLFDRLMCYSRGSEEDGDGGNSANESNLATKEKERVVEDKEEGVAELRSENKSTSFSSSEPPPISPVGTPYNNFQVDSFKLMELLGPEKVDPADVKLIKEKLFGYSTFWVTKEEPFGDLGEGILFLGNLRGKREDVFEKLQKQLAELMGDKYNLFMVEEPNAEGPDPRGGPRVSFGMLRKEVSETGPTTLWQYVIALLLFLLTIGSSVELGIASQINRLPPEVVKYFTDPDAIEPPDMQLLLPFVDAALPLAYGVLGVQLFHEIGHYLAAFPKNVKLSIPYFIPNITLGSFGAITQFKSILPDRRTQVDISLAGPFAGAALSLSMFAVGLLLSLNPDVSGVFVQVPSTLFQGSLLLGLISRATLGYTAMHAASVSIHPLMIAGWCGLTSTAFNLLPVGCLDGGRAVQGAFGKNALIAFGLTTYALLGLGVLGGPLSLPWGLYVLICQRTPEKPCLNDVTEVGSWRKAVVVAATFLVVLTLLPVWDELAEELGVGLVTTL